MGKVKAATLGNMNAAARSVGRSVRNVTGTVSGNYSYLRMRNAMKTFYSVEQILETRGKDNLKTVMRIAKQIQGFNAKTFTKIHNKFMGNEPKLVAQVQELISVYVTDIQTFERAFKALMEILEGAVKEADKMEESMLQDLQTTLELAVELAKHDQIVLPKEVTNKVDSKLKTLADKQMRKHQKGLKKMQTDATSIFKESKGKRIRGAVSTTTGLGWIFMKAKGRLNNFRKKGVSRLIDVQAALHEQIENKEVKSNFLSLVLEYLERMKYVDLLSDQFRDDINRIHETIFQSFFEIRTSIAQFMAIFQQDKGMEDIQKLVVELDESTAFLTNSIKSDMRLDADLIQSIEDFKNSASKSLEAIGNMGKTTLKSLEDEREAGGWIRAHQFAKVPGSK